MSSENQEIKNIPPLTFDQIQQEIRSRLEQGNLKPNAWDTTIRLLKDRSTPFPTAFDPLNKPEYKDNGLIYIVSRSEKFKDWIPDFDYLLALLKARQREAQNPNEDRYILYEIFKQYHPTSATESATIKGDIWLGTSNGTTPLFNKEPTMEFKGYGTDVQNQIRAYLADPAINNTLTRFSDPSVSVTPEQLQADLEAATLELLFPPQFPLPGYLRPTVPLPRIPNVLYYTNFRSPNQVSRHQLDYGQTQYLQYPTKN